MSSRLPPRYERNYKTISVEDQEKLANATIAIVGCGGLGGTMAEETENNIGIKKVEAARQRLKAVNSEVNLTLIDGWFNEKNAQNIFQGADLICDALDSISRRIELENACHKLNKPLVYAGIAGWFGMFGVSFPGDFSVANVFKDGKKSDKGMEKTWGNPAFTPWVLSSLAVAEAVKIIVGREPSLRHAWLQIDLLYMEFEIFEIFNKFE